MDIIIDLNKLGEIASKYQVKFKNVRIEDYKANFTKWFLKNYPEFSQIEEQILTKISEASKQLDTKGNASYYDMDRINTMIKMERTFGTYECMVYCEMTAFKYRMRIGHKKEQPLEQELKKVTWYEQMSVTLREKIGTSKEIISPKGDDCKNPFKG